MSDPKDMTGPREEADRIFEAGLGPDEVSATLGRFDEAARIAFLGRLAVRATLRDGDGDERGVGEDPTLIDTFERAYAADSDRTAEVARRKNLSDAAPWVAAMDAFNGDDEFVMKLCGRHVSRPTTIFMRYVADALGVAMTQVRQHFEASGQAPGIVGAEHKASGKPGSGRVEDFATAVRTADIPDELRARWLSE